MPTAPIRSRTSRSRPTKSESANHIRRKHRLSSAPDQRQNDHRRRQQADEADHDGSHVRGLRLQWNRIAVVGPNGLHAGISQSHLHLVASRLPEVQKDIRWTDLSPEIESSGPKSHCPSLISSSRPNQPWRSPSAARFHCATLSAIMRVDFIAVWLSWA